MVDEGFDSWVEVEVSGEGYTRGGPICYVPIVAHEYGAVVAEMDEADGIATRDKSKVTCRLCLEYIHA